MTLPNRRSVLRIGGAGIGALLSMPLFRASPALADALKMTMGVGLTNDGAPLVFAMQRDKLLDKAATELGLQIDADYLNFPVLLRMLQGLAAGQLDIGMLGSTPTIRNLSQPAAAVPIAIAGGGIKFPLQVPPNSSIKNLDDLKGKTVLTIVGSDLHLVLNLMLQAHFGTDDAKALGITVKNIQAFAELTRAQPGIDAVLNVEPAAQGAVNAGELVNLLLNDGTTGPAYDGPEGKGAGHKIASFAKTPFAPEAYYPHRIWWVARQEFLQQNPKAISRLAGGECAGDQARDANDSGRGDRSREPGLVQRPCRAAAVCGEYSLSSPRLVLDYRGRRADPGRPVKGEVDLSDGAHRRWRQASDGSRRAARSRSLGTRRQGPRSRRIPRYQGDRRARPSTVGDRSLDDTVTPSSVGSG